MSACQLRQRLVQLGLLAGVVFAASAQAAGVVGQGTWQTDLVGRDLDGNTANGYEAYYDKALNITWLADANPASSTQSWGQALDFAKNYKSLDGTLGWRLPKVVDSGAPGCEGVSFSGTDCGYNVDVTTGSELAHMFYVTLGNQAWADRSGTQRQSYGTTNTGPFNDFVIKGAYWYGQESASNSGNAWYFNFGTGMQATSLKGGKLYVWLVHDGDVASSTSVPEPSSALLALSGLCLAWGASAVRQRKR